MRFSYTRCFGFFLALILLSSGARAQDDFTREGHLGGRIQHTAAQGNHVFITQGAALTVLDRSTNDPQQVATLSFPGVVTGLALDGTLAVVSHGSTVDLVDITDPLNPASLGSLTLGTGDIVSLHAADGFVYVGQEDALRVIDVSDPTNPVEVGAEGLTEVQAVFASGANVYVLTEQVAADRRLRVIDVSDPANPDEDGDLAVPGARGLFALGTMVYLAGDDGLTIVDASNPAAPAQRGTLDVGTRLRALFVLGDVAYAAEASFSSAVFLINVANATTPQLLGQHTIDVQFSRIPSLAVTDDGGGRTAFVATFNSFNVLDVTNPNNPVEIGEFATPVAPLSMASRGEDLFLAQGDEVWYYEFVDGVPVLKSRTQAVLGAQFPRANKIAVAGNVLYVADFEGAIRLFDITDPVNPVARGQYTTPDEPAMEIRARGTLLYLLPFTLFQNTTPRIEIIDASDLDNPVKVGEVVLSGPVSDLFVPGGGGATKRALNEDVAYVAFEGGVELVDIADPSSPSSLAVIATTGVATGVWADGTTLFVGSAEGEQQEAVWTLEAFDVSDPSNPVSVAQGVPVQLLATWRWMTTGRCW